MRKLIQGGTVVSGGHETVADVLIDGEEIAQVRRAQHDVVAGIAGAPTRFVLRVFGQRIAALNAVQESPDKTPNAHRERRYDGSPCLVHQSSELCF